jgi:Signal transducing histidine kinase, homodimeric domain
VDQEKVDRLVDLVGELIVARNALPFLAASAEEEFNARRLGRQIKDEFAVLHRIAEDLRGGVMGMRMLPFSVAFASFPRLVRDLGRQLDKHVELVTEGDDTAADKDIIEALADPLAHLVRNSLDHGVERSADRVAAGKSPHATVRLRAMQAYLSDAEQVSNRAAAAVTERAQHMDRVIAGERGLAPGTPQRVAHAHATGRAGQRPGFDRAVLRAAPVLPIC